MWKVKTFKTREQMTKFICHHRVVWYEIFLNNIPYAIEYKPMIKKGVD